MGFRCGIVGLPNVGKSTLFNALTSAALADTGNYPFCTVEPNVGRVPVPDHELETIASIAKSTRIVATMLEVVDIAGLVRGASQGEGLGNQFLAQIREVDAILHMVRCFEDDQVSHVEGPIDPLRDIELIETELMLADLESLERQLDGVIKRARGADKEAKALQPLIGKALEVLRAGKPVRALDLTEDERPLLKMLHLLTAKPMLYVCNVDEQQASDGNAQSAAVAQRAADEGAQAVVVSAAIEAEIAALGDVEEKRAFLENLGLETAGLERVIHAGHHLLGLIRFMTAGPKEARAWNLRQGASAREAAGNIHSDMARGFICAETIAYEDFLASGGEAGAKATGKMRQEGADYTVKDRDVILFRFNV